MEFYNISRFRHYSSDVRAVASQTPTFLLLSLATILLRSTVFHSFGLNLLLISGLLLRISKIARGQMKDTQIRAMILLFLFIYLAIKLSQWCATFDQLMSLDHCVTIVEGSRSLNSVLHYRQNSRGGCREGYKMFTIEVIRKIITNDNATESMDLLPHICLRIYALFTDAPGHKNSKTGGRIWLSDS